MIPTADRLPLRQAASINAELANLALRAAHEWPLFLDTHQTESDLDIILGDYLVGALDYARSVPPLEYVHTAAIARNLAGDGPRQNPPPQRT